MIYKSGSSAFNIFVFMLLELEKCHVYIYTFYTHFNTVVLSQWSTLYRADNGCFIANNKYIQTY